MPWPYMDPKHFRWVQKELAQWKIYVKLGEVKIDEYLIKNIFFNFRLPSY